MVWTILSQTRKRTHRSPFLGRSKEIDAPKQAADFAILVQSPSVAGLVDEALDLESIGSSPFNQGSML
jgi:hypothetical protein